MNVVKRFLANRQALRLHIEEMKVTRDALKKRAVDNKHDTLAYRVANGGVNRLNDKIRRAERELQMLDKKWSW